MGRPKLKVQKLNGGLGRRTPSATMVTACVMQAVALASLVHETIYELKSIEDAEALGLNETYDTTNKVLVYHHLSRFFFRNPSATLHFMPVAQTVTLADMCDKDQDYLAKVYKSKAGEIRQGFVALNPVAGYVPTIEDGLDDDVIAAVTKAQALADSEFAKDRFAITFIEGRSFTGTATGIKDFRNLAETAPDVAVILGADNDISTSDAAYAGYAAVGDIVGLVSAAAVSQNAGELTEAFNLTDADEEAFINAGLSSGEHIDEYSDTDLDTLNDKGYIFGVATSGIAGFHIVDTHTCDALISDYAYVENVRTINEMIRAARASLLPRMKGRLYVDPDSGKLAPNTVKEMELSTIASQNNLLADGDLSGGVDCYIDPDQNILATSELQVLLTAVPVAIGRQITLKIGFKNPKTNS
ncbi:Protein of unknown function (DUF2586) [Maribacter dokdonensis]|uniref:DUF2586 family protein n=1 Tax=Maribacter dokdonensis TaxID=320912 RepID=UPI001B129A0D|nr:DUF2586 family protein [Maribacter dokdonensis]CAG2532930.1 Protein of unknown function (DUF2586) [Maribacter dokdonensis]